LDEDSVQAPSRQELLTIAALSDPVAPGWTRAGRSLQKHGYRPGSAFPRVTGPPTHYNAVAMRIVEHILSDPLSIVATRLHRFYGAALPFIEVTASDGRGVAYLWNPESRTFRMDGFREP